MHVILQQAVRWQMLARNPVDAVDPPKIERGAMTTYDLAQTADLIDATRETRVAITVILAVLCGLRRGEIAALRWRNINLDAAQLAVTESAEQTATGVRYKKPKSGKGRTVALSARVVSALRAHRIQQAEELLKLGVALTGETFVAAQADGSPSQPRTITHQWHLLLADKKTLPRIRFHDLRTRTRRICCPPAFIPRSPASASGTQRLGSRWTCIRTSCPECRKTLQRALTAR
jgi:integrase